MPTSPDPLLLISLVCAVLAAVRCIWADARIEDAEAQLADARRMYGAEVERSDRAAKEVTALTAAIQAKDAELNRLSRAEIKANAGASVVRVRLSGVRELVNTLATELWEAGINPMAVPGYREYAEGEQRRRDREADEGGGSEGSSGDPISLGLPADMTGTSETASPVLPATQVGTASDSGEPPWLVVMQAMGPREASRVAVQGMKLGEN